MKTKRENPKSALAVTPGKRPSLSDAAAKSTCGWSKDDAKLRLEENLKKLEELQFKLYADGGQSLLIVLQGIDASGKDGLIRKVFTAFNPQGTQVTSFKGPNKQELAHDYLWRIHAACPPRGSVGIFNRSHYEDLIVPMLNKNLNKVRLNNRIKQLNDFERLLTQEGTTVIKILLHISRNEQWERMASRLNESDRHWKFRIEDLAEREKWEQYMSTFTRVVSSTSTKYAPWFVVPANSKWFRDFAISEIVRSTIEDMGLKWPKSTTDIKIARRELNRLRKV